MLLYDSMYMTMSMTMTMTITMSMTINFKLYYFCYFIHMVIIYFKSFETSWITYPMCYIILDAS